MNCGNSQAFRWLGHGEAVPQMPHYRAFASLQTQPPTNGEPVLR
jgi:hypothetical protein